MTVHSDDRDRDVFNEVGMYLNDYPDAMRADYMPDMYGKAEDACNDPYCDAETLRTILRSTLDHMGYIDETNKSRCEGLEEQLQTMTNSMRYYQDNYFREITKRSRIGKLKHVLCK